MFLSLADRDKDAGLVAARRFAELGFSIAATAGTARLLESSRDPRSTRSWPRSARRSGVDAVDLISSGKVDLVVNTPRGRGPRADGMHIRRAAIVHGVACVTTVAAALAAAAGHRRGGRARARGALAAGVPRRRPAPARGVSAADEEARRIRPASTSPSTLGPLRLPNPIVAASGTFGHGAEVAALCDPRGLGAVTVKSVAVFASDGQPAAARRRGAGRRDAQLGRAARARASTRGSSTTCPRSKRAARASSRRSGAARVDDYAAAARALKAVAHRVVAVEVNLSCPNVEARGDVFAHVPETRRATRRARSSTSLGGAAPVFAKLSPNVTDLVEIAGAALDAGATGLTLVNTVMGLVDRRGRRARRAWARAAVGSRVRRSSRSRCARCWEVSPRVSRASPIIGTGGVSSGEDAVEMLLAGATAVGVGTATFADPRATLRIVDELEAWCAAQRRRARARPDRRTAMSSQNATEHRRSPCATGSRSRSTSPTSTTRRAARQGGRAVVRRRQGRARALLRGRARTRSRRCATLGFARVRRHQAARHPDHRRARGARARPPRRALPQLPRGGRRRHVARRSRGSARRRARRGRRSAGRRSRSRCSRAIPTRPRSTSGSRARSKRAAVVSCVRCTRSNACTRARRTSSRSFPVCASPTATCTIRRASARPTQVAARRRRRARGRPRGHARPPIRAPRRSGCTTTVADALASVASSARTPRDASRRPVAARRRLAMLHVAVLMSAMTVADRRRIATLIASRRSSTRRSHMANPPTLTPEQRQLALEKAARRAPSARRGEGQAQDRIAESRRAVRSGRPRRRDAATCSPS